MTEETRPDPEALLRRLQEEERKARRGRLKVFLGYASRVGKTRRMIEEMQRRQERGQDVVIGWVQRFDSAEASVPSGAFPRDVSSLLAGLEMVPPIEVDGRQEMNLEAILARKPSVCMVDGLAHANPASLKNAHRWQDVDELLDHGISVVTGINVQYLEGLQERIVALLHEGKRETVPEQFIREADEVVLVDVSPQEVNERMRESPDANRARWLAPRTLWTLRELALLYTADNVDASLQAYREEHHIQTVWQANERLMVVLTPHADGVDVVERARRNAERLHGQLVVVYVTPDGEWSNVTLDQRTAVQQALALARTYQANVDVLVDVDTAAAVLRHAQVHNVTQIFVGHSRRRLLPRLLFHTTVGRIINGAEGIDVHVTADPRQRVVARPTPSVPEDTAPESNPVNTKPPGRGHLKVFLGYAAGVGKTCEMLDQGHELKSRGIDAVIGYFEPHGRVETMARVEGLEIVERRKVVYRNHEFEEMDLDAVLARRPAVCLVDELAHTNVPGSQHEKRWQDVEAILDAGIDVLTTVNIQHLESLNDYVKRIARVQVRETVPDYIVNEADEIVIIDLATRALLNRLDRGVIYPPEKASRAREHFFREGNLAALRELTLRQGADVCENDTPHEELPGNERLMVCITENASAGALIRRCKRVADRLHAPAHAVHVVRKASAVSTVAEKHLELARLLGMTVDVIEGSNIPHTIVHHARKVGVTQMLLGRSPQTGWRDILYGSFIEQVLRLARDMDIHVVAHR